MNRCFLLGQLEDDVKFSFTLKKNPISIARFYIKLLNNSSVKIYCFNENADFCYRRLRRGDCIFLQGQINSQGAIIVHHIYRV